MLQLLHHNLHSSSLQGIMKTEACALAASLSAQLQQAARPALLVTKAVKQVVVVCVSRCCRHWGC